MRRAAFFAVLLLITPASFADLMPPLSGSISSAGGCVITGGNWTSFSISWEVAQNPNGTWHYEYDVETTGVRNGGPGLSHIILELSRNFEPADLLSTTGISEVEYNSAWGQGAGNPGFPAGVSIFGVKFGTDGNSIEFDSTRAPMWGDFYAKGGSDSYAYNSGLVSQGGCQIAVPDTTTGRVPAPGAALLVLMGVSMISGIRRRLA